MATRDATLAELDNWLRKMDDIDLRTMEAEEKLNDLRISNAEKLGKLQLEQIRRKAQTEEELNQEVLEKYIRAGGDAHAAMIYKKHQTELAALDELKEKEIRLRGEGARDLIEEEFRLRRESLEAEFETRIAGEVGLQNEVEKIKIKKEKEEKKRKAKANRDAMLTASQELGTTFGDFFRKGNVRRAKEAVMEQNPDLSEDQAMKAVRAAQTDAALKALAGFAKQLESTATEVAEAQSEIDTRLQGSKNKKSWGSYWKEMSDNITGNIAISPFLKQADAVNNLKTLVGKGIAFNVEQRAFLDTISEKIATTFEATDASLLKLVRIQQADTTAARLGMESALTAFLNNMYETTEYMTEAADSIRASIYEASALMDAEDATDFEYQVQKWMGSLYSVGFQNTQGLADALGKLAAGNVDSITDGGYGNLLVMAANKANLSIAEILADGLNDDETNALMQAMVEYLGGIYAETKDNKVVAQQFANVYGLTASDLKAAANLASDTTNIYKNNLNYGGMMKQLTEMAESMGSRTAVGTMVNNVIENLKYSTAATIGSNPALYTMYTVASMLDDTVGGIAIPTIGAFAMGNGVEIDLETTVADIMRTGAMAGGLLGGIGKMIGGLAKGAGGGFSGSGMLKAFGVNLDSSNATVVTRGSGDGLLTTASGMDTSLSTYIGNEDGNAVKDKMLTDEKDAANQQAIQALEEAQEIGMANIDEHVVQIYTLLNDVVLGSRSLHVTFGNTMGNAWSSSGSFTPSGVPGSL